MSTPVTLPPPSARAARPASPASPRPSAAWWLVAALGALVMAYGLAYVVVGPPMYPSNLAASFRARPWGIYPHALFGALAVGLGPLQFHRGLLRRRALHRRLGTLYVASCLLLGAAGLYMAAFSFGGTATHLGFGTLAALLLVATARAYGAARRGDIAAHRAWMIRGYALVFSAVTLRLLLPLLVVAYAGRFLPAYRVVAWLAWVPNLAWAEWYVRRPPRGPLPTATRTA